MRSAPKRRGRNSRAAGLHARAQPVGSLFAIRERIVARSGAFVFRATGRAPNRGYDSGGAQHQQTAPLDSRARGGFRLNSSILVIAHENLASAQAASTVT